ncbi:MAG: sel1 repeat family protein [Succinivibrio sp.]|nr:sel1 repeat family protein [Succinivibrio sp.]
MVLTQMYIRGIKVQSSREQALALTNKILREGRRGCLNHDARSCSLVGDVYTMNPLRHDDIKARSFYLKGCALLDSWSCAMLSTEYDQKYDRITDGDTLSKAVSYYTERCNLGFSHACINLYLAYVHPSLDKSTQNPALGAQSLHKACALDDGLSCLALGNLYSQGAGVPADAALALEHYRHGCELGESQACGRVGYYYLNGLVVERDEEEGLAQLDYACNLGDNAACLTLGNYLLKQHGEDAQGLKEAMDLYELACIRDDGEACIALGDIHLKTDRSNLSRREAARLYEQACGFENGQGCLKLIEARKQELNMPAQEEYYERACRFGAQEGCDKLAEYYGVSVN